MADAPDWEELRDVAGDRDGSLEELVRELDLAWVAEAKVGVDLREEGDRLVGRCPLHDDEDPSFAIFWPEGPDGKARWGCWSCPDPRGGVGRHGDVLDLIAAWKGVGVVAAIGYARVYLREYADAGVSRAPRAPSPAPRGLTEAQRAYVRDAKLRDPAGALLRVAQARGWGWPRGRLAAADTVMRYALGEGEGGELVIPHVDERGNLVGAKVRAGSSPPRALRGSRLRAWYRGNVAAPPQDLAVVVEGESDAWAADAAYPGAAWGLPAGVASARSIDLGPVLRAARIVIAFDADEAGHAASAGLRDRLTREGYRGTTTRLLPPGGRDLAELGPGWLRDALESGRWS